MAVTVRCTGIQFGETSVYVNFDSGQQLEFASLEAAKEFANGVDAPSETTLAQKMLMRWWLERDANAENVNLIFGKTLVFDMSQALSIDVT